jgi:predicted Rossmann fold nucleotide-binding protein DprA/Smf involved in DNA uptake
LRTELVIALNSQLVQGLDPMPPGVWRAIRHLPESEILPFARLRLPKSDLRSIQTRLDRIEEFEAALTELRVAGVQAITEFDPEYPPTWNETLREKRPSYLFSMGNLELLSKPAVGVVGSRSIDTDGSAFAAQIGAEAVKLGYAVVSGGAKGADENAMRAAIQAGGTAIGYLADSLLKHAAKWNLDSGRVCLASPYGPDIGFQVGMAMNRNKFIYGGSVATVVVASDLETGGTWAGAIEALKLELCPLLVRACKLPGNRALISRGGHPMEHPNNLEKYLTYPRKSQTSLL